MSVNPLDNLDVFYGELTPARAMVYARLEGLESTAGLTLGGFVRGPIRIGPPIPGNTMAANYRFRNLGSEPSLLAAAAIPDPCYWSPHLDPSDIETCFNTRIYEIEIELRRNDHVIERVNRKLAFRPLGVKGSLFSYAGKTWILRGADENSGSAFVNLTRALPSSLSPVGVLTNRLRIFDMSSGDVAHQAVLCRRISRSPDYGAVLFPSDRNDVVASVRHQCPNLLIGRWVRQGGELPSMSNSDFLIAHVFDLKEFAQWAAAIPIPLVAVRALWVQPGNAKGLNPPSENVVREIDRLQRDLAPYGQFAGYIV
jgi:hypothetical protein